jgi:hypothetical protein
VQTGAVPSPESIAKAQIAPFFSWMKERGLAFSDYEALWRWVATELGKLSNSIREFGGYFRYRVVGRFVRGREVGGSA